jgi:hypothetical protein
VPTWLLGVVIVGLAVGLAVLSVRVVHRRIPHKTLVEHQEVTSYVLAVVAAVYAVLLAFVVVIVWQTFQDASTDAAHEAAAIGLTYRDAEALGPRGAGLRGSLERYASSVVEQEWPRMAEEHDESRHTDVALNRVWDSYRALGDEPGSEPTFYEEGLKRLHDAVELRRERILSSKSQLPPPLWVVLIVGAIISVGLAAFFAVDRLASHVYMIGALATVVALVLFLVLSLDLPYSGDIGVGPSAMQDTLHEFAHSGP